MGVVSDFVESHFGTRTTVRDTHFVVGSDGARIALNSPGRFVLIITNTGGNTLALSVDSRPYERSTLILGAGGGSCVLEASEDGELVTHEFFARTLAGTTDVVVTEVLAI